MSQIGRYDALRGSIDTLTGNTGGPVPPSGGNINILGDGNINVSGDPGASTLTIELSGHIVIDEFCTTGPEARMCLENNAITMGGTDTNVSLNVFPQGTGGLTVATGNISAASGGFIAANDNTDTGASALQFFKSRSVNPIQSGDLLGSVIYSGYDTGSAATVSAVIRAASTGTIAPDQVPSQLEFYTHDNNALGVQLALTIDNSQDALFENNVTATSFITSNVANNLDITGSIISSGGINPDIDITLDPQGTGTVNIAYATENALAFYGASGSLVEVGPLEDGELVIGSTGLAPVAATLTAGDGITITNAAGSITISATGRSVAQVQTTDDTPTTLASVILNEEEMITLTAVVNGFISTFNQSTGGRILVTAYRPTGGNITLVGLPVVDENTTSTTSIDADVDTGTQSVRIQVTGVAAETWNWSTTYDVLIS